MQASTDGGLMTGDKYWGQTAGRRRGRGEGRSRKQAQHGGCDAPGSEYIQMP